MKETENITSASNAQKLVENRAEKFSCEKKPKKPCTFNIAPKLEKEVKVENENKKKYLGNCLPKDSRGLLAEDFASLVGTVNVDLADDIISKGYSGMPQSRSHFHNLNVLLQSLHDMEPGDIVEARLITQMTALHTQGMEYLRRAENSEMLCHIEAYQKFAVKLLRLQNETVETLMRYRRKGEQKVIVQHVNVNDGGQAVVAGTMGKVGGGGDEKYSEVPHG